MSVNRYKLLVMTPEVDGEWVKYADIVEMRAAYDNRTRDYYAQGDAYDALRIRAETAEAKLTRVENIAYMLRVEGNRASNGHTFGQQAAISKARQIADDLYVVIGDPA